MGLAAEFEHDELSENKDYIFVNIDSKNELENTGIIIKKSSTNDDRIKNNGLLVSGAENIKIINNGTIISEMTRTKPVVGGQGNGIVHYKDTEGAPNTVISSLENSGIIKGSVIKLKTYNSSSVVNGNGISSTSVWSSPSEIGNIYNTGIIYGKAYSESENYTDDSYANGNGVIVYSSTTSRTSKLGDIKNSGIIKGDSYYSSYEIKKNNGHGNGILSLARITGVKTEIGNIENNGIVSGIAEVNGEKSSEISGSGNGIGLFGNLIGGTGDNTNLSKIYNLGIISGYSDDENAIESKNIKYSGNGIAIKGSIKENIENSGVMKGTQSAIMANDIVGKVDNYGVMAGREIYSNGIELIKNNSTKIPVDLGEIVPSSENNHGIYIKLQNELIAGERTGKVALDDDRDVVIEEMIIAQNLNGNTLNTSGKIVLNADKTEVFDKTNLNFVGWDSYFSYASMLDSESNMIVPQDIKYENHIINGAGIKTGTLTFGEGITVSLGNTTVNAYKTAITQDENSSLVAVNTIFNGGGLKNEDAVINIKGDNVLTKINGTSIINGKTDVSGSNSIVSIGNEVIVNGDLTSNKDGNNTLNLGDGATSEELRLFHNVDGFAKINTSGNVTAYETAKITTGDIHVKDGNFIVRVDGTDVDSQGRVKGHALYNHIGEVIIEVPNADAPVTYAQHHDQAQLIFKASGLSEGTIIAMNGTDVTNLYDPQIGTMSIAHTAIKHKDGNGLLTGDVEIAALNFDEIFGGHGNLPTPELDSTPEEPNNPELPRPEEPGNSNSGDKGDLEDIYDSIVKGDQLPSLAPTTDTENKTEDEARKGLLTLLDQIYANNPYVQSAKLSKENVGLFREQILSTKMPKENEWIAEGHGIYSIDEYGKSRDVKVGNTAISNNYSNKGVTTGLLGTGEYGVAQDTSLGFAVGGSHQKLDMSMNSKLKGEAIYLGVFGKKKVDNYLFTAGLGYQYGQYDGTRTIMNEYQSIRNTGEVKTDSFDIYGEVRYTFEDEKGRKIEPKLRLSQLFVNEKSVSEKNGVLAIDMDKKSYSIPELEIGVDFIEPIKVKSGKLEAKFGVGVARTFGKDKNSVTAKMKNSEEFKVVGPDFEDTKLRLSAGVDYEHVNGVFYNANLGVDISKDTKKDISAKVGIGYRF